MQSENTHYLIARLFGRLVCVLAIIILAGAIFPPFLVDGGDSGFAVRRMFIGTFVLLLGVSLLMKHRSPRTVVARVCAAGALVFAGADLVEFLAQAFPHPGPFSFRHDVSEAVGIHMAVGGIIGSLARVFVFSGEGRPNRSWPEVFAIVLAVVAGASFVAQWQFAGAVGRVDSVGKDTAAACGTIAMLLLSAGIICSGPQTSMLRVTLVSTRKASLVRRLMTLVLLTPALLVLAVFILGRTDFIALSPGSAVLATVYVLVVFTVALFSLETVIVLGNQRQSVEETREMFTARLQEQAAQLQETVAQRTQELSRANGHLGSLNERLQLALRSSNYGVWELDFMTDRLVWDDRMLEIYGLSRKDFEGVGRDWTRRLHPSDAEAAKAVLRNIIESKSSSYDTKFRILRPDGSLRHVEAHGYLQRDSSGKPVRLAGLNRDISAEQELFDALNVAEQRWKLAIEGTNDAVWDWNLKTGFIYHDNQWSGMLGYGADEVEPSIENLHKLVHPEDLPACEEQIQRHLAGHTPVYQCEYRMREKKGEWSWILDRGKVVTFSPDGKPVRMVGTHADITARKNMEQHLLRTEELADQVSRVALIGGWELDIPTSRLSWSSGMKRIYELDEGQEPTFGAALDRFPADARQTLEAALLEAKTSAKAFDLELPLDTYRARRAWVRVQGKAESRDGAPVRIFGAIQDITAKHQSEIARRLLETQLFNAQKMETLGTLAGGIAHDFNNLLTGIIGYHELAADSVPEDHPARACLAESRTASLRARELVEQILTFGRQSSSESHEDADLRLVVEEARRFLRATLPATISINTVMPPNCGNVVADTTQIHQVLVNLGSNAAHAMRDKGGTLTLALEKAEIDAEKGAALGGLPAGSYVCLSATDTGHGMDEATMQRIFDPFFTTKSAREGNGLGLAVVHGIVRAHRGAINVESQVGVGSSFHIYLPAAAEKRTRVEIDSSPAPAGMGELVYVVDDEDIVLRSTMVTLERKGYRVASFGSAELCLAQLRQTNGVCQALITDQTMPGMQGTDLAAAARELIPGLPVVIMSGYFSKIPTQALDQLGQVKLLAKPFTGNELARTLHAALRSAGSLRAQALSDS